MKKKDAEGIDPAPLGQEMARIYMSKQWTMPWRLYLLSREWPAIVGAEVARLTSPAFFRRNTLWMYVQDSAWMHHLQFIKSDLLARVNRVLADEPVADLRWQLAPPFPEPPLRRLPQPHGVNPEQAQAFAQLSTAIANPECRAALQHLWHTFAAHARKPPG